MPTCFVVAEQMRSIDVHPADIVLEPAARNTAPAVAVAALMACLRDPGAVLMVMPSDHHIHHLPAFYEALRTGERLAREGYLITFGVVPDRPETGYGYIRRGSAMPWGAEQGEDRAGAAFRIARFVEKPDAATAAAYLDSGEYFWNSGMFLFAAESMRTELARLAPENCFRLRKSRAKGAQGFGFFPA